MGVSATFGFFIVCVLALTSIPTKQKNFVPIKIVKLKIVSVS